MRNWVLDMLAIVVGVMIAELVLDAIHVQTRRYLDGGGAGSARGAEEACY